METISPKRFLCCFLLRGHPYQPTVTLRTCLVHCWHSPKCWPYRHGLNAHTCSWHQRVDFELCRWVVLANGLLLVGLIPQVSEPEFVLCRTGNLECRSGAPVWGSKFPDDSVEHSQDQFWFSLFPSLGQGRKEEAATLTEAYDKTSHQCPSPQAKEEKPLFVFERYWSWIPAPCSTLPHCCGCLWNMRSTHDSLLPWFTWINNKAPHWEVIISSHQGMWRVWKCARMIYPQHPETPKVIHFSRRRKQDWAWKFPMHFMKGNYRAEI